LQAGATDGQLLPRGDIEMALVLDQAFTLQGVATVLELSYDDALQLVQRGELKAYRLAGQWYVPWPELEQYLEKTFSEQTNEA